MYASTKGKTFGLTNLGDRGEKNRSFSTKK